MYYQQFRTSFIKHFSLSLYSHASYDRKVGNKELGEKRKEVVMAHFKLPSRHLRNFRFSQRCCL